MRGTKVSEELPACVTATNIFLHPLLEEGTTPSTRGERRIQMALKNRAESLCAGCPMLAQCLTDAVTKHEVSGFVAGTTKRQRQEIRSRLGIRIRQEDLDSYVGVSSNHQFNHQEILRIRASNPDQPLSVIAQKVGCSVSTVKRHLRRAELEVEDLKSSSRTTAFDPEVVLATARRLKLGPRTSVA